MQKIKLKKKTLKILENVTFIKHKKDARNNVVYNLWLNHRFYDVICKFQTEIPFIVKANMAKWNKNKVVSAILIADFWLYLYVVGER